jgi:hypothetical protein
MRSLDEVLHVAVLVESGLNDCAIARQTGIPRSTVREWRQTRRWAPRTEGPRPVPTAGGCAVCGHHLHRFDALPDTYAYLLGLYLGDGCLSGHRRGVLRLRIVLDARYPEIIRECVEAMRDLLPANRQLVQAKHGENAVEVSTYSKQLVCLFPQHGPGRKHEREIALTAWQQDIATRRPGLLLRGLIHSHPKDLLRLMQPPRHRVAGHEPVEYLGRAA